MKKNNINLQKQTLLCWHAKNNGIKVVQSALELLKEQSINIEQVIYLIQEETDTSELENSNFTFVKYKIDLENPTNHMEIHNILKKEVLPIVVDIKNLHINISPGTPAMHAVWLILHAQGNFPINTKIWSSQISQETQKQWIEEVDFLKNTYMGELKKWNEKSGTVATYNIESESNKRYQVLQQLGSFAKVPFVPLLIVGERGTGKTRLVQTLVSKVKQKDTVTLFCGGLTHQEAEELIFGKEENGTTTREGLLKKADGKILFLDEIQELPMQTQRRLLRVFQGTKQEFRPIGSEKETNVNVEFVCTSAKPLVEIKNTLYPDLFDRLTHFVISLPPLREAYVDIHQDWINCWKEMDVTIDDRFDIIPWNKKLEKALKNDPLNGNFRDIQCLIGFVKAHWDKSDVDESIKKAIEAWKDRQKQFSTFTGESFLGEGSYRERVEWFRQQLTLWALKVNSDDWAEAAKALDVNEKTLRNNFKDLEKNQ